MRLSKPWPAKYKINAASPWGPRAKHPITGKATFHHGVDVAMPTGTELVAPADGTVAHKGSGASGGNTLIIKHADDLYTVYYHLHKPSHLKVGARVSEGDPIGLVGSTGASTGPHLHFETRHSRRWGDTFDPETILGDSSASKAVSAPQSAPKLVVDGIAGPKTWKAVQRFLKAEGHYTGAITGKTGRTTYKALQSWLNEVL